MINQQGEKSPCIIVCIMAELIKADGQRQKVEPKNGEKFKLEELQGYVDGYIEAIFLDDDTVMVVNEEGKLLGLPYNQLASIKFLHEKGYHEPIVGDVLVCKRNQM